MSNLKHLPCFAGRREWVTQRVLSVCAADSMTHLVQMLNEREVFLSELLKTRGVGRKWVAEFVAAFPVKQSVIDYYHEWCPYHKRLDYQGPAINFEI